MPGALVGMDIADLKQVLGPEQPAYRAKQLYQGLYRQKISELSQLSNLPVLLKQELALQYRLGLPEVEHYFDSIDGTRRYLLRLEDGSLALPRGASLQLERPSISPAGSQPGRRRVRRRPRMASASARARSPVSSRV